MRTIEEVFTTKNGPGIRVLGRVNVDAKEVYGELSDVFTTFYSRRGLVYLPAAFQDGTRVSECRVENQTGIGRDGREICGQMELFQELGSLDMKVRITSLPPKTNYDYGNERYADYSVTPSLQERPSFLAYFNSPNVAKQRNPGREFQERNRFFRFMIEEYQGRAVQQWKAVFDVFPRGYGC